MTYLSFGNEFSVPVSLGDQSSILWGWALVFLRIISKGKNPRSLKLQQWWLCLWLGSKACSVSMQKMANTSLCTADLHLQCFRAALVRSGNERIKSMWLEAKQQWCNKMLGSIWWSEDGLGKESYSPCSACQACCYLWFPYFCFFPLSQVLSTEFSLWLWNIPKIEGWGIHLDALLWLKLCLLLPMGAHNMTLTQQDLIPVSQDGLLILKEIKSDFRALVPTAAMMFRSCILSFCFFYGEICPCSGLHWWGL